MTLMIAAFALLASAADESAQPKPAAHSQDGFWKLIAEMLGEARLSKPARDAITLRISKTNDADNVIGGREP